MIYYYCPDTNDPSGGIRKIYTHVDILNKNGLSASVLHATKGFRCTWFENSSKVCYLTRTDIADTDYVVVPEFFNLCYMNKKRRDPGSKAFQELYARTSKMVIFNQGTYITFNGNSFDPSELSNIHRDEKTLAALVVSEDGERFLKYAFPELKLFRVHNSINTNLFFPGTVKKKQICFMPRRNREYALNVINILKSRGILKEFNILAIENMTERQTAAIMSESLIFLSFGFPEGFSMPPAEAMAGGCVVIGYHGMGGREYFHPDFCFPIETGNILDFVFTVEKVIRTLDDNPAMLKDMALKGSSYIRKNYPIEREEEDVLNCWKSLTA